LPDALTKPPTRNSRVAQWLRTIPQAGWLHRDRILAWSAIFLAFEVAAFCFVILWTHDFFIRIDPPTTTDFVSFYAAGKLALAGTPQLAYAQSAHYAAEMAATAPNVPYNFFFYPPVYLLVCAPLALLPYIVSFVAFEVATIAGWLLVMRRILQVPGWAWCIPVLAYPSVFWTFGLGQNAFLTAGLIGAATLLLEAQPIAAGVLIGLMAYKPHLALLVPVALAAGGHWRAFGAATATVAALVGFSIAAFGVDTWHAYLLALNTTQDAYEAWRVDLNAFVTPYGAVRVLGGGAGTARAVQVVCTILVAAIVAWIWRRSACIALRSAALTAAMPLAVPVALMYDLLLTMVAIGWIVRLGIRTGFRPWEKLVMFFCFVVPLVCRHFGQATHIPLGPLAPAALLAICCVRHVRASRGKGGAPAPRPVARTVQAMDLTSRPGRAPVSHPFSNIGTPETSVAA
jgi:alpha-1,2-mannosyltransferase